jgi:hypothetical protein
MHSISKCNGFLKEKPGIGSFHCLLTNLHFFSQNLDSMVTSYALSNFLAEEIHAGMLRRRFALLTARLKHFAKFSVEPTENAVCPQENRATIRRLD